MGVLPLQFRRGENAQSLGLSGFELYDIEGIAGGIRPGMIVPIHVRGAVQKTIQAIVRIDTPYEIQYYQHGGILQYVLRQLIR
jgi:aconitate hydratase